MHTKFNFFSSRPATGLWSLCFGVLSALAGVNAWAYKVERVCEQTEATSKKPSMKVCKTLLVKAGAEGKADKKEETKEEKPAPAHH